MLCLKKFFFIRPFFFKGSLAFESMILQSRLLAKQILLLTEPRFFRVRSTAKLSSKYRALPYTPRLHKCILHALLDIL